MRIKGNYWRLHVPLARDLICFNFNTLHSGRAVYADITKAMGKQLPRLTDVNRNENIYIRNQS